MYSPFGVLQLGFVLHVTLLLVFDDKAAVIQGESPSVMNQFESQTTTLSIVVKWEF